MTSMQLDRISPLANIHQDLRLTSPAGKTELPRTLFIRMAATLDLISISQLAQTCRTFRQICSSVDTRILDAHMAGLGTIVSGSFRGDVLTVSDLHGKFFPGLNQATIFAKYTTAHTLRIRPFYTNRWFQNALYAVQNCPSLVALRLTSGGKPETVFTLLPHCSKLLTLHLNGTIVNTTGIDEIVNRCTSLTDLSIFIDGREQTVTALNRLTKLPGLVSLELRCPDFVAISDEAITALTSTRDMMSLRIQAQGLTMTTIDSLAQRASGLKSLELRNFTSDTDSYAVNQAWCKLFTSATSLAEVSLEGVTITNAAMFVLRTSYRFSVLSTPRWLHGQPMRPMITLTNVKSTTAPPNPRARSNSLPNRALYSRLPKPVS